MCLAFRVRDVGGGRDVVERGVDTSAVLFHKIECNINTHVD